MCAARLVAVLVLLLALGQHALAAPASNDINVSVQKFNELLYVRATMHVDAQPAEVWRVLIDYDNASRFMTDVQESRVLQRSGNTWRVLQKTRVQYGPVALPVETVREVRLFEPQRIESRLLSGTLDKADTTTELAVDGAGTRLTYRADLASKNFIPTAVLKSEAEQRFAQLREEVLRRKNRGATR
jgi:carbon monoxide dehydrogenase subunit G